MGSTVAISTGAWLRHTYGPRSTMDFTRLGRRNKKSRQPRKAARPSSVKPTQALIRSIHPAQSLTPRQPRHHRSVHPRRRQLPSPVQRREQPAHRPVYPPAVRLPPGRFGDILGVQSQPQATQHRRLVGLPGDHRRADERRHQVGHTNTVAAPFQLQRLGKPAHGELRGRVDGHLRYAIQPRCRAHVEHPACGVARRNGKAA